MEESRLARTACTALSSMVMTSLAWTTSMGRPAATGVALQFGADDVLRADQKDADVVVPRRLNRAFDLRLRRPVGTHRVQGYDAWHGVVGLAGFLRRPELRGPYSTRTSGRHDAASCARGNWDTRRANGLSRHRGRGGCWCAALECRRFGLGIADSFFGPRPSTAGQNSN